MIHPDHTTPQGGTSQEAPHDQDVTSQEGSCDPCATKENTVTVTNPPRHINSYLTDVTSQSSDFSDDHGEQSITNQPIKSENCANDSDVLNLTSESCDTTTRSHDLDCDASYNLDHSNYDTSQDLDHNSFLNTSEAETSCEHDNTHLEDSVAVEDIEVNNDGDDGDDDADSVGGSKEFHYKFVASNFTIKVCDRVIVVTVWY